MNKYHKGWRWCRQQKEKEQQAIIAEYRATDLINKYIKNDRKNQKFF